MPIDYDTRKKRREEMLNELPPALRENISLRNVEAVAALPDHAREKLSSAVEAGLRNIHEALRRLKENPEASLDDLATGHAAAAVVASPQERPIGHIAPLEVQEVAPAEMVALIQACYPHMPQLAAEALATSPPMKPVAIAIEGHRAILNSALSDFVIVVYYALLKESLSQVEQAISKNHVFQQALQQSGLRQ